jgi:hypothetical protein
MSITFSNDSSHLTMKGSGKVQIKTSIKIYGTGTELPVTIEADLITYRITYIKSIINHW